MRPSKRATERPLMRRTMRSRSAFLRAPLSCLLPLLLLPAFAQPQPTPQAASPHSASASTATACTLSGTLRDPSGTPIPGVRIAVTHKITDITTTATTNDQGAWSLSNLPPGHYTVKIQPPAQFLGTSIADVLLTPTTHPIDLTLQPAQPLPMPMLAGATQFESGSATPTDYVRVSVNAVTGPMGYVQAPALATATQTLSSQQQALVASQRYNFPSVIFYISAAPLVSLPTTGSTSTIQAAQETDRNPLWLDATFFLEPLDATGNPMPSACTDGSIQILGLLPQANIAAPKERTAAAVAQGVVDVSGALASFYPGVQEQVGAATKALNVIFQDVFPPRPVAYQYPNLNGNCEVGWFFRPDNSATAGQASILGIQTGIVLLKTSSDIRQIRLTGQTLSAWSKPPTSTSKTLFVGPNTPIGIVTLPNQDNIDYDNLSSLAMFPALIPRGRAMKILHIDTEDQFLTFARANALVGTNPTFDYVTNASLQIFLAQSTPVATPPTPPTPPAPSPSAPSAPNPPPAHHKHKPTAP